MHILSFDIGSKNLAFCYFECCQNNKKETNIKKWDIQDISQTSKKYDLHVTTQLLLNFLDELTQNMYIYHDTENTEKEKEQDQEYEKEKEKEKEKLFFLDAVLIENQPVLKNPIMKSIQMVIYTYFQIYKRNNNLTYKVEFISANQKNKAYKILEQETGNNIINNASINAKTNKGYKFNKLLSIYVCQQILQENIKNEEIIHFFEKNKKKDDLSDCFLQGYTYLFA